MTKNDLRHWIIGLVSAVISGAATSFTAIVVAPETFNLETGLGKISAVMGVGAAFSLANYLKQKPIPDCDKDPEDCEKVI